VRTATQEVSRIDLTQLNVWLDVVFTTLYPIIVVALIVHFLISIPTGRFKKSWIDGHWPEHDEPHPPALPKFLHFQHLTMMFVLGFTGFAIRFPLFDGGRTTMRYIHYVAMIIVVTNLIWRFWYAFGSRRRDWRAFAVTGRDTRSMLGVVAYYAYLSKTKPHTDKYNVLQKGTYLVMAVMMIAQAICGFALLEFWKIPFINLTPSEVLLGWNLGLAVGSLALAVAYMRILHYFLTWMFIVITTIHMYLSATVDIPVTLDFFGLGKHEEDDAHVHGHGAVPEPVPPESY
jgi:cytochrome b subunit of formate dehydrogenase